MPAAFSRTGQPRRVRTSWRGLLLIVLAAALGACTRVQLPPVGPVPPSLPYASSRQLQRALETQKKIHSLTALADYSLESNGRHFSGREALLVQGAEAMRVEVLNPFGQPVLYLVIRSGRFSAYAVSGNRFVTGRAIPFNMNRLLGFPLNVGEIDRLIRGDLTGGTAVRWGPLGYDPVRRAYVVDLHFPTEEQERLWIDPTRLVAKRVERRNAQGERTLQVELKDYTTVEGIPFPRRLDLDFPRDDARLSLTYRHVTLNEAINPSLFELTPPPGSRITDLD